MQLKCTVKKVMTSKTPDGIDGSVTLSFVVNEGVIPQLHDLMTMQNEVALVMFQKIQPTLNFDKPLRSKKED